MPALRTVFVVKSRPRVSDHDNYKRTKRSHERVGICGHERGGGALRPTANSTSSEKAVHSRSLVSSSRKASELTIEAIYASRTTRERSFSDDQLPDEGERARLISDITRLIREPQMPETTRTAGLTLIGWLARRMPGEAPHAIGVAEARQSERRLRATQRKPR